MVVVDTNILAYLLIAGPSTKLAKELWHKDREWYSEAFLLTEFSNLLATTVGRGDLELPAAHELLAYAENLIEGRLVAVSHQNALDYAAIYSVSVYDARYLVVAAHYGKRLVTEDRKLRKAAPALTVSLKEAVEQI